MSDTPRTDAERKRLKRSKTCPSDPVSADFARQLERELNAAKAALSGRTVSCSNCNEVAAKRCDWKEDSDANWDTSCKQCMCFEHAPPSEQGYKFCHHCGSTINFIKYRES